MTTWSVQTTLSTAPLLLIPLLLLLLGLLVVLLVGRGHQVVQQQARQEQEQAQAPDQEAQRSQVSIPNWTTIARSVQALRRARARARNLTPSSQAQVRTPPPHAPRASRAEMRANRTDKRNRRSIMAARQLLIYRKTLSSLLEEAVRVSLFGASTLTLTGNAEAEDSLLRTVPARTTRTRHASQLRLVARSPHRLAARQAVHRVRAQKRRVRVPEVRREVLRPRLQGYA